MSRDTVKTRLNKLNNPNPHENWVISEKSNRTESAKAILAKCKERESRKQHEIIIVDSKTYKLREIGDKPKLKKK